MKEIGMEYQVIDACPNDHIIYYEQYASENKFPQCEIRRYRTDQVPKKVPRKVLHYIPIIPHFQRLFRCQRIAELWITMQRIEMKMVFFKCLQMVLR